MPNNDPAPYPAGGDVSYITGVSTKAPPLTSFGDTLEKQIETVTLALFDLPNLQEYDSPILDFVAPGFNDVRNGVTVARTREGSVQFWKESRHALFPDYRLIPDVVNCDIDEVEGEAKVWIIARLLGFPDGVERELVAQFWWNKRRGSWKCYRMVSDRGYHQDGTISSEKR